MRSHDEQAGFAMHLSSVISCDLTKYLNHLEHCSMLILLLLLQSGFRLENGIREAVLLWDGINTIQGLFTCIAAMHHKIAI